MTRALVLNASYEPLGVIPMRRAVWLVLDEKADIVSAREGEAIRSEQLTLDAPSVIRLRHYIKIPFSHGPGRPTIAGLVARDGKMCAYCAKRPVESIDHVIPRSRNGEHTWLNTVGACTPCNGRKADRTPAEAGMQLKVTPTVPPGGRWLIFALADLDPAWDDYFKVPTTKAALAALVT